MSTHDLCFRAKIRKNEYPCKPQFYYIKVGCKGVFITQTCYPDVHLDSGLVRIYFCSGVYFSDVVVSCCFMLDEKDKELSAAVSYLHIIFY